MKRHPLFSRGAPGALRGVLLAMVCAGLGACASVSVREVIPLSKAPARQPQLIAVEPFDFDHDMVRVSRKGEELDHFKTTMQKEMSGNLVERFRKYVGRTEPVTPGSPLPPGTWLVTGRFTKVNQGSRLMRSTLGFGTGGTKLDVTATVSEMTATGPRRFLIIQTTGGTNAMPGAIMGVVVWPMALSGSQGLVAGLSSDCRRSSREIVSALAMFMREHGLQVAKGTPPPKRLGTLPWLPSPKPHGQD